MGDNTIKTPHWGKDLWTRALLNGFRSKKTFAEAIGCEVHRVTHWVSMPTPPKHVRKGFDGALCRILGVDKRSLFTDWDPTAPLAPVASPADAPADSPADGEEACRRELLAIVQVIKGKHLRTLRDTARALALGA